jgi:hypothetical protein
VVVLLLVLVLLVLVLVLVLLVPAPVLLVLLVPVLLVLLLVLLLLLLLLLVCSVVDELKPRADMGSRLAEYSSHRASSIDALSGSAAAAMPLPCCSHCHCLAPLTALCLHC